MAFFILKGHTLWSSPIITYSRYLLFLPTWPIVLIINISEILLTWCCLPFFTYMAYCSNHQYIWNTPHLMLNNNQSIIHTDYCYAINYGLSPPFFYKHLVPQTNCDILHLNSFKRDVYYFLKHIELFSVARYLQFNACFICVRVYTINKESMWIYHKSCTNGGLDMKRFWLHDDSSLIKDCSWRVLITQCLITFFF